MGIHNSITDQAQKGIFKFHDVFSKLLGLKAMDNDMEKGMKLVMRIWDDHECIYVKAREQQFKVRENLI